MAYGNISVMAWRKSVSVWRNGNIIEKRYGKQKMAAWRISVMAKISVSARNVNGEKLKSWHSENRP